MSAVTEIRSEQAEAHVPALNLIRKLLMLEAAMYSVITPMLPYFARTLPASKPELGVLAGAYTAGAIPGAIIGGRLSQRHGVRRTTLVGTLLFALAVPAFGIATNLVTLDILRFIAGIGGGMTWGGLMTWVIGIAPEGRRGELVGTALGSGIVGTLIGPVLGVVAVEVSIPLVFTLIGVGSIAMSALLMRAPEPERHADRASAPLRALLARPRALLGIWLTTLEAVAFGALYVLLPLRMAQLGGSSVEIGATFLGSSVIAMFVAPRVGLICDRRGTFLPIVIALSASACMIVLLPLPSSVLVVAVLSIVVMGAPLSAFLVPSVSMMSDAAQAAGVALAVSTMLFNLAYAFGETFGAPVAATISHHASDVIPLGGVAVLMLFTLIPVTRLRRADRHEGPPPTPREPRAPAATAAVASAQREPGSARREPSETPSVALAASTEVDCNVERTSAMRSCSHPVRSG